MLPRSVRAVGWLLGTGGPLLLVVLWTLVFVTDWPRGAWLRVMFAGRLRGMPDHTAMLLGVLSSAAVVWLLIALSVLSDRGCEPALRRVEALLPLRGRWLRYLLIAGALLLLILVAVFLIPVPMPGS